MKVKKSDINLLIMLVGVLIAVASYFLVFQSYNEKTAALEAENAVLEEEVAGLQELADNKAYYESEIVRMESENQEIMMHFPSEVRVEDEIMYTVALENEHSIWVNNLSSGDTQLVQVAVAAPEQPTNDAVVEEGAAPAGDAVVASGGLKDTVFLYNSPFSISFKTTYRSMKDIVYAIVTSDERMSLSSLSLSYDAETGCLSGSLDSNMYTMSGTDAVYEELNIPGVAIGTADFFKSGTVLNLNVGASVDAEDDADAEEGADEGADEDADEDEEEKSDDKVTSED
ncbi:MAG: hypothetical protein IJZ44_03455 [Lachnospiraceae bacterium]|nr:hypothetical protein [Lachnospiraceae bacterium]